MGLHFHKYVWISVIWHLTVGNYYLHFQVQTSGIQAWDWTQLFFTIKVNRAQHESANCSFPLSYSFQSEYIHKKVPICPFFSQRTKVIFSRPKSHYFTLNTLQWIIKFKCLIMANNVLDRWVLSLSTHHQEGWLKLRLPGCTTSPTRLQFSRSEMGS